MKMNIEEKAKAYDEAIEMAKEYFDSPRTCIDINVLPKLFPELKESEDERIRKELIEMVRLSCTNGDDVDKKIDWLEKQGEQKPVPKFKIGDTMRTLQEVKDGWTDGLPFVVSIDSEYYNCNSEKIAIKDQDDYEYPPMNRKQKPTKVEPKFKIGDKIYLKPEYRMPDDDTPIANTVKEIIGIDDEHYRFDGSYIFIEDQDKYELVEQKPTWSEEDENLFKSCITRIQMVDSDATLIDWLKSLKDKVQPKQERSEEDENNILFLTAIIEECFKDKENITLYGDTECAQFTKEDVIERLKSLKPQNRWKPSDEQIEILDMVLTNESMDDNIARILRELRGQLKKLREE